MEFDINDLISKNKASNEDKNNSKSKPGRPKVDEPKNAKTMVYLTQKEHDDFAKIAEQLDISLSSYLRTLIIKNK